MGCRGRGQFDIFQHFWGSSGWRSLYITDYSNLETFIVLLGQNYVTYTLAFFNNHYIKFRLEKLEDSISKTITSGGSWVSRKIEKKDL